MMENQKTNFNYPEIITHIGSCFPHVSFSVVNIMQILPVSYCGYANFQ